MPGPSSFLRSFPPRTAGFTWIEMIIILAVIGILAAMAIPSLQDQALKRQVKDGMALADVAKKGVQAIWEATGEMPKKNKDAGVPEKEKIIGAMVKEVSIDDGAVTLVFGNNASKALDGKKLTLRPAVVADTPTVPIAWLCAQVGVPKGMEIRGKDETDIQPSWLPVECRTPTAK